MNEQSANKRNDEKVLNSKRELIDGLLDVYNDYKLLYEMFQDEHYKRIMELVLKNLKKINL